MRVSRGLQFHSSARKRTVLLLQAIFFGIAAILLALYPSFAPVQAASNTGFKWTPQTAAADRSWNKVEWSPELGIFVAVAINATSNVMYSSDGITWSSTQAGNSNLRDVVWSAARGQFLALSPNGGTRTSTDGINWVNAGNIPQGAQWQSVTYSPSLDVYVAVQCGVGTVGCNGTAGDRVAISTNGGATWTMQADAADHQWRNVIWSPELGLFIALAGGTQAVMTSPDGINWTAQTTPNGIWWRTTWSPDLNLLVSVSTDGKVMTSPDGINWTERTAPAGTWRDVTWSPDLNLFVAVASGGTTNRVMTSPDGITWTAMSAASNFAWQSVEWSPALQTFVAVASNGTQQVMTGAMITATTDPVATNITDSAATLHGDYEDNYPGANILFRYRVAGSAGPFTETPVQPTTTDGSFSANISGLNPGTTYEYTIVVQWPGASGTQELVGGLETFTTESSQVRYRKTVDPVVTSITPGQTFTYTVTVENLGTTNLTGLSFTDFLSDVVDDATYDNNVNATIGTATWNGSDQINWNGDVNAGQTATITYSFAMNDPVTGDGVLLNGIVGTGPGSNCTASPAIDPDCRTISPLPILSSQKTLVGPANPQAGDTVNYEFTIANTGASAASSVSVADDLTGVLDDAVYNGDASTPSGNVTYNPTTERIIWNGDLAASGDPGDSVTVTFSVTVNGADALADAVLNNALISSDCPNPPIFDPGDPDFEANCVTSTPVAAWMARKTVSPTGNINPGQTVGYTIEVMNTGAVDLTGGGAPVIDDDLTDVLDDATYNNDENATTGTPTYTEPTLNWTGDLNAGQTATITYSATVNQADDLGNGLLVNTIAGPMNCPAMPTGNPDDPDFNPDCAVLSAITLAAEPGGPGAPGDGGSGDGDGTGEDLADTGQNSLMILVATILVIFISLGVLASQRKVKS